MSIYALHYDRLFQVIVLADNCSDRTVDIAKALNADVLERIDPAKTGKGHALQWALGQVELANFDVVSFVDADCNVAPNFLMVVDQAFNCGADAVQVHYDFRPDAASKVSLIHHLVSCSESYFLHFGRSALGLMGLLRGTGMAIRANVLNEIPWTAGGLAEDTEYSIHLNLSGYRIVYRVDSSVSSSATATLQQSRVQRTRWIAGNVNLVFDHAIELIVMSVRQGRPALIELLLLLLLLNRYLLAVLGILMLCLDLFLIRYLGFELLIVAGLALFFIAMHLFGGILFVSNKRRCLVALGGLISYLPWYSVVALRALVLRRKISWKRTDRH